MSCARSTPSSALQVVVPDADRDAEVWVDGNYVGLVSALDVESTGDLRLAPGVHRVEVRKPGRFPYQRTVTVERTGAPPTIVLEAELLEDFQ